MKNNVLSSRVHAPKKPFSSSSVYSFGNVVTAPGRSMLRVIPARPCFGLGHDHHVMDYGVVVELRCFFLNGLRNRSDYPA